MWVLYGNPYEEMFCVIRVDEAIFTDLNCVEVEIVLQKFRIVIGN